MDRKTECLACKSSDISGVDTIISEFITEKVFGVQNKHIPVKLYKCTECGMSFYDKRFSDEENEKLYLDYRSKDYQIMRQKYDSWYTPEINDALSKDENSLKIHRDLIGRICDKHLRGKIKHALDYGGDTGSIYPAGLNIEKQFVFDISGVQTVEGVIKLSSYKEARELDYDFIMCNQVMEHVNNLDDFLVRIKNLGSSNTLFYFEVPYDSPFNKDFFDNLQFLFNPYFSYKVIYDRLIKMRKTGFFAPMVEHVNYFTPNALGKLFLRNGFRVVDLQINRVDCGWIKARIISCVCTLK